MLSLPQGTLGGKITSEMNQKGHKFSEDCLALNIWTKPQIGEKSNAVIVWMYGGGKHDLRQVCSGISLNHFSLFLRWLFHFGIQWGPPCRRKRYCGRNHQVCTTR